MAWYNGIHITPEVLIVDLGLADTYYHVHTYHDKIIGTVLEVFKPTDDGPEIVAKTAIQRQPNTYRLIIDDLMSTDEYKKHKLKLFLDGV